MVYAPWHLMMGCGLTCLSNACIIRRSCFGEACTPLNEEFDKGSNGEGGCSWGCTIGTTSMLFFEWLPCCHVGAAMGLPCCHGAAMGLPCCHGAAMGLPCCHGAAMLPCCHGAAMLPWGCHVAMGLQDDVAHQIFLALCIPSSVAVNSPVTHSSDFFGFVVWVQYGWLAWFDQGSNGYGCNMGAMAFFFNGRA